MKLIPKIPEYEQEPDNYLLEYQVVDLKSKKYGFIIDIEVLEMIYEMKYNQAAEINSLKRMVENSKIKKATLEQKTQNRLEEIQEKLINSYM